VIINIANNMVKRYNNKLKKGGCITFTLTTLQSTAIILLVVWDLSWKGLALWRAARKNQGIWFITLLILNTVGILPIIFLIITRQPSKKNRAV
jgi:hypothetical protein